MSEAAKKPVKITETILRDAHQSLIATRMTTEQMLPIVDKMDQIGYHAVRGKKLSQVLLNRADVTADCFKGGVLKIIPDGNTQTFNEVELVFADAPAYTLTVKLNGKGKITRNISGSRLYEGDRLVVEAQPAEGHEVEKVLFNGTEVVAGADGKYSVTVTENTTVEVFFKEKQAQPGGEDETPGGQKGCSGNVGIVGGALAAAALGAGVLLAAKKKRG